MHGARYEDGDERSLTPATDFGILGRLFLRKIS